jgi:hypothetical protein
LLNSLSSVIDCRSQGERRALALAVGMIGSLILVSLAFQPLDSLTVPSDFSLISLNLLLLLVIGDLLALQLVSHQRAGAEAEGSADCCSGTWMAHSGADKPACCGTAQRSDTSPFFACGQRATGTADHQHCSSQNHDFGSPEKSFRSMHDLFPFYLRTVLKTFPRFAASFAFPIGLPRSGR